MQSLCPLSMGIAVLMLQAGSFCNLCADSKPLASAASHGAHSFHDMRKLLCCRSFTSLAYLDIHTTWFELLGQGWLLQDLYTFKQ